MSKMNFSIARMQPADCGTVARLEGEIFSRPWTEQGFLDALDQDGPVFLVAKDSEGVLLGYAGMYTSPGEGEITNVAVDSSCRGQGIADALLEQMEEIARKEGITQIFLEVRCSNIPAISLYKKKGFTECGIRKGFYQAPKEDAYVMRLDVK